MNTRPIADKLIRRFGTRNPIRIAEELGYIIIETPLCGIRGYHQYVQRCNIIYLDNNLSEQDRLWVCAHELGHSIMHKGLNRIFMDTCTHMISNRYETEADRFAADLLFDDEVIENLHDYSVQTVAECLGVTIDIARYKIGMETKEYNRC